MQYVSTLKSASKLVAKIWGLSWVVVTCSGFLVLRSCPGGEFIRWRTSHGPLVRIQVDYDSLGILDGFDAAGTDKDSRLKAITDAAATWTNVGTSSFEYRITSTGPVAPQSNGDWQCWDIFGHKPGFESAWIWAQADPDASVAGHLASTITYHCSGDTIRAFAMQINQGFLWSSLTGGPSSLRQDLQSVVTHELGHGLGLMHLIVNKDGVPLSGDEGDPRAGGVYGDIDPPCPPRGSFATEANQATMCATNGRGVVIARTLHSDDIAGLEFLYPGQGPKFVSLVRDGGNDDGDSFNTVSETPITNAGQLPADLTFHFEFACDGQLNVREARPSMTFTFVDSSNLAKYPGTHATYEMGVRFDHDDHSDDEFNYYLKIDGQTVFNEEFDSGDYGCGDLDQVRMRVTP